MASEPTWKAVKFGGGGGGRMPPDSPISFYTSHGSSYKRSVPLCPSNGDVLATPLVSICLFVSFSVCQSVSLSSTKFWDLNISRDKWLLRQEHCKNKACVPDGDKCIFSLEFRHLHIKQLRYGDKHSGRGLSLHRHAPDHGVMQLVCGKKFYVRIRVLASQRKSYDHTHHLAHKSCFTKQFRSLLGW